MINKLEGDSERVIRRTLSNKSIELLLPLVGRNGKVRIRLFQPDGTLYADTKFLSQLSPKVEVLRLPKLKEKIDLIDHLRILLNKIKNLSPVNYQYPLYQEFLNGNP